MVEYGGWTKCTTPKQKHLPLWLYTKQVHGLLVWPCERKMFLFLWRVMEGLPSITQSTWGSEALVAISGTWSNGAGSCLCHWHTDYQPHSPLASSLVERMALFRPSQVAAPSITNNAEDSGCLSFLGLCWWWPGETTTATLHSSPASSNLDVV